LERLRPIQPWEYAHDTTLLVVSDLSACLFSESWCISDDGGEQLKVEWKDGWKSLKESDCIVVKLVYSYKKLSAKAMHQGETSEAEDDVVLSKKVRMI
jgi:hypothetical protein